ncbi:MAG: TVP38/TMEM64 family protein [Rhizobiales bacterium]|nr:TVP38/TMEM64 family protein [Hyphomicrobiales bacterium]
MAFGISQGWHKLLSINALVENREMLGDFVEDNFALTLLAFSALYILAVTLSLPGAVILTLTGGFLFGWFVGGIVIVLSATIGATLLFIAAQSAFGATLRKKAGPLVGKFAEGFEKDAFNYLLFIRLVPLFPFWLCNLAPAILGVKLRTYIITTFLGIIPGTFAFALTGNGLNSIIEAQRAANPDCATNANCTIDISVSNFITPEILAGFAALGLVAVIPVLLKRFRRS